MFVLDADVILTDCRYQRDSRHAVTRQVLDMLRQSGHPLGITTQALLEVAGVLSFNVSAHLISTLPTAIQTQYQLVVIPNPESVPDYAGCSFAELVHQMQEKMGLGDAVMSVQLRKFAPPNSTLLTWNAKHFVGKIAIPVLTPAEWLAQQNPTGPTP